MDKCMGIFPTNCEIPRANYTFCRTNINAYCKPAAQPAVFNDFHENQLTNVEVDSRQHH